MSVGIIFRGTRAASAGPLLAVTTATFGAGFIESEIDFGAPIETHSALAGSTHSPGYIIVSGRLPNGDKGLSMYGIDRNGVVRTEPAVELALDSSFLFFDTARVGGRETLLVGGVNGIFRVDTTDGRLQTLAHLPSLFRTGSTQALEHLDFAVDVNADGLDDLLLQDFDGIQVSLQSADGFEPPQLMRLTPEFQYADDRAQFTAVEVLSFDFNLDKRLDVAALRGNEFVVFESNDSTSGFAVDPREYGIDIEVTDEYTLRRFESDMLSVDQSDLRLTRIERIDDLNGDELPDIVTHTTLSDSVFDKRTEYRVYLASAGDDGIFYRRDRYSTIASDGFQIGLQIVPDSVANRSNIVTTSVDFGFRELIASLFSRSLTLDIGLHQLDGDDAYSSEPSFRSQAKVRFDISTGFISTPAIRFADFDGDGLVDLLTQTSETALAFQSAISANARDRSADFEWETTLPRDGSLVETSNVNGDGKADVLIRYGSGDAEQLRNTLRVLISAAPPPAAR